MFTFICGEPVGLFVASLGRIDGENYFIMPLLVVVGFNRFVN